MNCGSDFPKGSGVELGGIYDCETCKAAGMPYKFRIWNPDLKQFLSPIIVSEMFDDYLITMKWVMHMDMARSMEVMRMKRVPEQTIVDIKNETKVHSTYHFDCEAVSMRLSL